MNHRMWQHPATVANLALLRERGVQIIGPEDGPLAEGESGPGRLSEPADIIDFGSPAGRIFGQQSQIRYTRRGDGPEVIRNRINGNARIVAE